MGLESIEDWEYDGVRLFLFLKSKLVPPSEMHIFINKVSLSRFEDVLNFDMTFAFTRSVQKENSMIYCFQKVTVNFSVYRTLKTIQWFIEESWTTPSACYWKNKRETEGTRMFGWSEAGQRWVGCPKLSRAETLSRGWLREIRVMNSTISKSVVTRVTSDL